MQFSVARALTTNEVTCQEFAKAFKEYLGSDSVTDEEQATTLAKKRAQSRKGCRTSSKLQAQRIKLVEKVMEVSRVRVRQSRVTCTFIIMPARTRGDDGINGAASERYLFCNFKHETFQKN